MASATEFGYIAVEGPIGVGKTTLARRLAQSYGGRTLLETPEENPFLARFYENPRANALSTQLYFLLQRVRQIQGLRQRDLFDPVVIGDYMMDKDRLFAELNLEADEYQLYLQVFEQVVDAEAAQPDLVIYLQAPVNVLQERIANRGVPYEDGMDHHYLHRLVAAYTRFFYNYESAPLVIVNAAEIDIAYSDADYRMLFEQLQTIKKGRHYLNPLPF